MSTSTESADDQRRHAMAYHEAGHAAVGLWFEHPVERVSIEPHEGSDARVSLSWDEDADEHLLFEDLAVRQVPIERRIMAALAGVIAQRRAAPECCDEDWDGHADRHAVYLYMEHLDVPNDEVLALQFRVFELRTAVLVDRLWSRIERIANRLLEAGTLTGEEARYAFCDPRFRDGDADVPFDVA